MKKREYKALLLASDGRNFTLDGWGKTPKEAWNSVEMRHSRYYSFYPVQVVIADKQLGFSPNQTIIDAPPPLEPFIGRKIKTLQKYVKKAYNIFMENKWTVNNIDVFLNYISKLYLEENYLQKCKV